MRLENLKMFQWTDERACTTVSFKFNPRYFAKALRNDFNHLVILVILVIIIIIINYYYYYSLLFFIIIVLIILNI